MCVNAQPASPTTLISRTVQAIRECVTERDNQTHSAWKWSLAISMAAVIAHDGWQLSHGVQVSVRDFALAIMAVVAGHGIGIGQAKDQ
jgi:hypothetical protein